MAVINMESIQLWAKNLHRWYNEKFVPVPISSTVVATQKLGILSASLKHLQFALISDIPAMKVMPPALRKQIFATLLLKVLLLQFSASI